MRHSELIHLVSSPVVVDTDLFVVFCVMCEHRAGLFVLALCHPCNQHSLISHVALYGSGVLWLQVTEPKLDWLKLKSKCVGSDNIKKNPNNLKNKKQQLSKARSGGYTISTTVFPSLSLSFLCVGSCSG